MSHTHKPNHPGYVVIGKTRTLTWDHVKKSHEHPFVIYDPDSKPHIKGFAGQKSTSHYSHETLSRTSGFTYNVIASWLFPGIDQEYCEHIYKHLHDYDHIYVIGGGISKWSGVNDFMSYVREMHPNSVSRFTSKRYFRLRDFSDDEAREIFKQFTAKHS